ncbi:DNA repair protein REV1 [Lingula anatina]|uniref:DNA repair protein REV1 n=1 Tax=Lingula anatina TaxID=7574 RepID=A0A1S3II24_LINAN|nr:DNA repair protein REV1 [Lingula anatina]|eukprot:XP_013397890.1 DNA repair protein REV1 [Lingula anatina]
MSSMQRGTKRQTVDKDGWGSRGGYMNAKKQKLQEQFQEEKPVAQTEEGQSSNIFHGVAIFVNGYTNPSANQLKRLMMLHGGKYIHYLSKLSVTHVIASNLPDSKIRDLKVQKVVRPDWITDSIKAGKLLSHVPYLLYTARSKLQPALSFSSHATSSTHQPHFGNEAVSNNNSSCQSAYNSRLETESNGNSVSSSKTKHYSSSRNDLFCEEGYLSGCTSLSRHSPIRNSISPATISHHSSITESVSVVKKLPDFHHGAAQPSMSEQNLNKELSDSGSKHFKSTTLMREKVSGQRDSSGEAASFLKDSAFHIPPPRRTVDVSRAHPFLKNSDPVFKDLSSTSSVSSLSSAGTSSPMPASTSPSSCLLQTLNKGPDGNNASSTTPPNTNQHVPDKSAHFSGPFRMSDNVERSASQQISPSRILVNAQRSSSNVQPFSVSPQSKISESGQGSGGSGQTSGSGGQLHPSSSVASTARSGQGSSSRGQYSPHSRMSKAGEANFVAEFYSHSRLHYLSTWGAEFKAYVNELQSKSCDFLGRAHLKEMMQKRKNGTDASWDIALDRLSVSYGEKLSSEICDISDSGMGIKKFNSDKIKQLSEESGRVIMHIDMDSFFVSVGLRNRPDLSGKPVAVTHSRGKGVPDKSEKDVEKEFSLWHKKKEERMRKNKKSGIQQSSELDSQTNLDDDLDTDLGEVQDKPGPVQQSSEATFHSMAEIASCSYEARKAGVKNGMFMGQARRLCPELVTIPYDFEGYKTVAQQLYDIIASYTHDIEAVSCDEMYVDCTELLQDTGASPEELAAIVRQQIREVTKCNASAGLAGNILLARMCTRVAKPNGQFYLPPDQVTDFMKTQSIQDIPGVGRSTSSRLKSMNIQTCGDLQKVSLSTLQKEFGPKTGQSLHRFCRGIDDRPIKVEKERKSVSAEINYGIRFTKWEEVEKFLYELAEEVHNRMSKVKVKGKCITVKLKVRSQDAPKETAKFMGHGVCDNLAKSVTLATVTDEADLIGQESVKLVRQLKIDAEDFRGIGIQVSKLEDNSGKSTVRGGKQSILAYTKQLPGPGQDGSNVSGTSRQTKAEVTVDSGTKMAETPDMFELARRKTAKGVLPPLPNLNVTVTTARAVQAEAETYLPSPSQVDPEVLRELPPDIREQIENQIKSHKEKATAAAFTQNAPLAKMAAENDGEPLPGCSHWRVPTPPSTESTTKNDTRDKTNVDSDDAEKRPRHLSGPIVPLPSLSQVDMSCFDALPPEMQKELKDAYERQEKKQQQQELLSKQKSPTKNSSPNRAGKKKGSPLFKVPHGKPGKHKKLSPKKLNFANQPKISSVMNQPAKGVVMEQTRNQRNNSNNTPGGVGSVQTKGVTVEQDKPAVNLCGAVTWCEVKTLLMEWVQSMTAPVEEDLDIIVQYVSELVEDKNLEMVDLTLKFLRRQVQKTASKEWSSGFQNVLRMAQLVVQAFYGSSLKWEHL